MSGVERGGLGEGEACPVGRQAWETSEAPNPAGSYSQGVSVGNLLFISGQTPRLPNGVRRQRAPFAEQARLALDNLQAIAQGAGASIARAAMVTVYLTDPKTQAAQFDEIYREYLDPAIPFPARAIVESALPNGAIEITAVVPL